MTSSFHRICACGLSLLLGFLLLLTPSAQAAPARQERPQAHTVQANETLSEIAKQYGLALSEIMAYNGIENGDEIREGQVLRLPAAAPAVSPTPAAPDPDPAPIPEPSLYSLNRRYTVRLGDTLIRIAARFGLSVDALQELNRLDDAAAGQLRAGQVLILPGAAADFAVATEEPIHVVVAGESLGTIAAAYGVPLAALQRRNRLPDPDAIFVGQELRIPAVSQIDPRPRAQIGPPASRFHYHMVSPGETLSHIVRIYDTTEGALLAFNEIWDGTTIVAGMDLRIPYGPSQPAERFPPTPRSGTRFLVSISRQQCWVFRGNTLLHSWNCSTGHDEWVTRTGTFPIKTRLELAKSSAYRLDMPYWLGLYDVGQFENGIHGIPVRWSTGEKLWKELIGQPATFGCAMLMDEDAADLFGLSYLGMPVHIVK